MIVMIGPLADSGTANLALTLLGMRADFTILDPRNFGSKWHIEWGFENGSMTGRIRTPRRDIAMGDISVIWAHMLMIPDRADDPDKPQTAGPPPALAPLIAFVDAFPGRVVNRPSVASSNSVKPYQAGLIASHGFPPIPTLVTTSPEDARAFIDANGGEVIFKSISWRRSRVRRVTPEDLARLDHVRNCPTQFQKFIPGNDIRVHRVDQELFATEIVASADDYRYVPVHGERTMRAVDLPKEVAARCLTLAEGLGMDVCGIDLRRTPDGEYYCFEVNPIPGYIFYEQFTGQRIGDAIAHWLHTCPATVEGAAV